MGLTETSERLLVPHWDELPPAAQGALAAGGYDRSWFTAPATPPAVRLTVLNLYVKLSGLGLWRFVAARQDAPPGALHFSCTAVDDLKRDLRARADFTSPHDCGTAWQSREKRAVAALHFKHFAGWERTQVQAHIDPRGLLLRSALWWLVPIVPLAQLLAHALDPRGYTEVARVRDLLLAQGWDRAPLLGAKSAGALPEPAHPGQRFRRPRP